MQFVDAMTLEPLRTPSVVKESLDPGGFSIRDVFSPANPYRGSIDGSLVLSGLPIGVTQLALDTPPYERLRLPALDILENQSDIDLGTVLVTRGAKLDVELLDRGGSPRIGIPVRLDQGPALSPVAPSRRGRASLSYLEDVQLMARISEFH